MPLFTNYPNADTAVINLLKALSVDVNSEVIIDELEKHPDYPSLLSISDVLQSIGINNAAFRIEATELTAVPCPFIAHTKLNDGDLVVINKKEGDNYFVSTQKWNKHKLSTKEFNDLFAGIVLTAEAPSIDASNSLTAHPLSKFKIPAIISGCTLLFIAALLLSGYFSTLNWLPGVLALFKTAGLVTSILLLVQSIDSNNPLVQRLCQSGNNTNCNAILSSNAAKVFEGLTWSEVGFFYFAGTWLILLFGGNSSIVLAVLAFLNFISLPYTVYSVYYQWRIARQWCVLCCTVQALLWLEFIPLTDNSYVTPFSFSITQHDYLLFFVCLVSPVVLWMVLKPMLLKIQQLKPLKEQLRTFKYNAELFNQVLTAQPRYAQPDEEWSIVLGNVEANNIITMVTNPYCQPCAKMHKQLNELLQQNGDVQARIIFTATNNEDDPKTPLSRHLMALNDLKDKRIVEKAMHDWYERKQKDYEAWAKDYPIELKETEYHKIDKQFAWCQVAEVAVTPTILLNGYPLPQIYRLPDLKYMLQ